MSRSTTENIECPHCHKEGEFELWSTVDGTLNPELREKIFTGELFMYHCPHCGKVTAIPARLTYQDSNNLFALFFDFFKPDNYDYKPVGPPSDESDEPDNSIFRVVYGLNRLREKIVILERGLNDVVIERLKYMICHIIKPELATKGYELYFERTEEPTDEFPHGTIFFFYEDVEKNTVENLHFPMDKYYEHCMACDLDPRMTVKGVTCIDEGWISKQLKEE